MINQYEVASYLADELPQIKEDLKRVSPALSIFKSIQCLTDYTRGKVEQHDLRIVKKCFAIAENIYSGGNALVKTAVENIFIYSFSSLLNLGNKDEKEHYRALCQYAYIQLMCNRCLHQGSNVFINEMK